MKSLLLVTLLVLLVASSVSAQDMPNLVPIDVDLSWSIPAYPSGGVHVAGRSIWENGVGYITSSFWPVTGISCAPGACLWMVEYTGGIPLLNGQGNAVTGSYDIHSVLFTDPVIDVFRHPAEGGHINVGLVSVPELAILRSFTKRLGGQKFNDFVNPTLQRVTAWGAARLLGARSEGVYVVLPTKILEVQEWCSGVALIKWLIFLALVFVFVGRIGLPWSAAALLGAAALIGLEANILRVAGIGAGFTKDSMGWVTMGLGVAQVVGLGCGFCKRQIDD